MRSRGISSTKGRIKIATAQGLAMNTNVHALTEKIQALNTEQIHEVESFVEFLRVRGEGRSLAHASAVTSEPAFAAVWDNPEDDAYDAL
jgi:hypothetical protein